MISHQEGKEFLFSARGAELLGLPDIPMRVPPLIDTSLHRLGEIEREPWVFRVRHVGTWRVKTRPRISIFLAGSKNRSFGVSLTVPARSLYSSIDEVFSDLRKAEFAVRSRTWNAVSFVTPEEDEVTLLRRINDERGERLKKSLSVEPKVMTEAEIIEFAYHRRYA